ncbi:MAG: hypothetical protein ABIO45_13865 [Burkholderiaceae bacterium]
MTLGDILDQYAVRPTSTEADFDHVAPQVSPEVLGDGIAEAFRSDQTPAFGNMVGQLFGGSDSSQRAGLLNQLIAAAGPAILAKLGGVLGGAGAATSSGSGGGGGLLGNVLGGLFGGGSQDAPAHISPADADRITPAQVREMAEAAKQSDPGIMDRVGGFYAQHPELVKILGGAALAIALGRMANKNPR